MLLMPPNPEAKTVTARDASGDSPIGDRPDDALCWDAVQRRDPAFDGQFVYCVQSTGIYCRPICPSRRPRRDRVSFAPDPAAAEAAGYRPCSRCKPQADTSQEERALVEAICTVLDRDPEVTPTLDGLADEFGIDPHRLRRLFVRFMAISPHDFVAARRFARLRSLLRDGDAVTGALYEAGFGSSSRLYEAARRNLGMTPSTYRRGGKGKHIAFAIAPCRLGHILVARTDKGVAAVYLGDDPASLERELRAEYPSAEIARDPDGVEQAIATLVDYLDGRGPHPALPVDLQATAFQRQVWQTLQDIPYGETRTYKQVAEMIGKPNAVRAVGRACGSNPVSLTIPCHRVVGTGGGLHGYRWGLDRKRALLEIEAEASAARASTVGLGKSTKAG